MKLYRGLKASEYHSYDTLKQKQVRKGWDLILSIRSTGNLEYPLHLNKVVTNLNKLQKLTRQIFTDNKEIAERYSKRTKGTLVEIDVPITEIHKHFIIEFQNYTKRKEKFELTYLIKSETLFAHQKKWKLRIITF
jgi:hypothetical protein